MPTAPPKPPPGKPAAPPASSGPPAPARREPMKLTTPTPTFAPPRIVVNAVEGWGKTSMGAYAPGSAVLMARGESGYLTLLGNKRVPAVPAMSLETWTDTLALVDGLADDPQGVKVLVFDALGGFERLCHEHVCQRDFKGDWGEKGFLSYHKGFERSVGDWLGLLQRLDRLREAQGVAIVLLSHSKVKSFKNPLGEDFDRYAPDCHDKTWGVSHKWADAVLFGTFLTIVDRQSGRAKGIGRTDRVLYTERRDAFDAKNRYGMDESLDIPADPAAVWGVVWQAIGGPTDA